MKRIFYTLFQFRNNINSALRFISDFTRDFRIQR